MRPDMRPDMRLDMFHQMMGRPGIRPIDGGQISPLTTGID